jgi:hypothetical protein
MAEAELTAWKRLLNTPEPPALGPARRAGTLSETELVVAMSPILAGAKVSAINGELIRALLLLWHDHLDASHSISQGIENADASFIHAIMHRREPDAGNSKYWWRRVGNHPAFPEIARGADELLRSRGAGDLAKRLLPGGVWDANAFVDACDAALSLPESDPQGKLLREIQRIETQVLLEHLVGDAK